MKYEDVNMNGVYINGYGILLPEIKDSEEFIKRIEQGERLEHTSIDYVTECMNSRSYRRMDRFSVLALLCFENLMCKFKDAYEPNDIGTAVNTTYGCLEVNVDYLSELIEQDYKDVSPIKFSHTVYNACLGHICKKFKLKGPSTMLLSSNSIYIAMSLLNSKKVKYMLVGGVEACLGELSDDFHSRDVITTECGISLALANEMNESTIGKIIDFNEYNFGGHPYLGDSSFDAQQINKNMLDLLEKYEISSEDIGLVVSSSLMSEELDEEIQAIQSIFGERVIIKSLQSVVGETLGASLELNMLYASLYLKNSEHLNYALVNHYDISGNYITYLISRA